MTDLFPSKQFLFLFCRPSIVSFHFSFVQFLTVKWCFYKHEFTARCCSWHSLKQQQKDYSNPWTCTLLKTVADELCFSELETIVTRLWLINTDPYQDFFCSNIIDSFPLFFEYSHLRYLVAFYSPPHFAASPMFPLLPPFSTPPPPHCISHNFPLLTIFRENLGLD